MFALFTLFFLVFQSRTLKKNHETTAISQCGSVKRSLLLFFCENAAQIAKIARKNGCFFKMRIDNDFFKCFNIIKE